MNITSNEQHCLLVSRSQTDMKYDLLKEAVRFMACSSGVCGHTYALTSRSFCFPVFFLSNEFLLSLNHQQIVQICKFEWISEAIWLTSDSPEAQTVSSGQHILRFDPNPCNHSFLLYICSPAGDAVSTRVEPALLLHNFTFCSAPMTLALPAASGRHQSIGRKRDTDRN